MYLPCFFWDQYQQCSSYNDKPNQKKKILELRHNQTRTNKVLN
uniref:Photosystem II protein L n=1 Tax=Kadsura heteroclita TaxID=124781 RepID=A0A890CF77_9MAGN|nr:photosystem II protein L [Kadsura heteroclita]QRG30576.1 photosystem II protein L [Kadsura heteroclita]